MQKRAQSHAQRHFTRLVAQQLAAGWGLFLHPGRAEKCSVQKRRIKAPIKSGNCSNTMGRKPGTGAPPLAEARPAATRSPQKCLSNCLSGRQSQFPKRQGWGKRRQRSPGASGIVPCFYSVSLSAIRTFVVLALTRSCRCPVLAARCGIASLHSLAIPGSTGVLDNQAIRRRNEAILLLVTT